MKTVKTQWLCLIKESQGQPREEQWVRGVLRPYRDGVKQSVVSETLVFFNNIQVEVMLHKIPEWVSDVEAEDNVFVYVDTPKAFGITTEDYTWLLLNTQSNYTTGTRLNKYWAFTASNGTLTPTDNTAPVVTMPNVQALEQAEDHLRSALFAANVLLDKTN